MSMYESMPNIEADDRIPVAVGLVFDHRRRVLIGCRTVRDRYFGKWEFPGGKIRADETVEQALYRELNEELGICVIGSAPFDSFSYDYPDRKVMLDFHLVNDYIGEPSAREQQDLCWVEIERLREYDMLAPNIRVIDQLEKYFRQERIHESCV